MRRRMALRLWRARIARGQFAADRGGAVPDIKEGLPNRPWYKHEIYAPGFYTGYGVKTLPAVRESIEQKQWKLADEEIAHVGKIIENAGEAIQGAAAELARATK